MGADVKIFEDFKSMRCSLIYVLVCSYIIYVLQAVSVMYLITTIVIEKKKKKKIVIEKENCLHFKLHCHFIGYKILNHNFFLKNNFKLIEKINSKSI